MFAAASTCDLGCHSHWVVLDDEGKRAVYVRGDSLAPHIELRCALRVGKPGMSERRFVLMEQVDFMFRSSRGHEQVLTEER